MQSSIKETERYKKKNIYKKISSFYANYPFAVV